MNHKPLHMHSMMVHGVIAFAPMAALSLVFEMTGSTVGPVGPDVWAFLLRGSLAAMLVLSVPATLSGITERNHMYAGWPSSHRAKLVLSLALVLMVSGELIALGGTVGPSNVVSLTGFAVVVGNCCVVLALSYFGLRITLGRQGFGTTSYIADLDREPPIDILSAVAAFSGDAPKLIDVREEQY